MIAWRKTRMTLFGAAALAIIVAAIAARVHIDQTTEKQLAENNRLAAAIAPLKKSTQEISALRGQIAELLARRQVIEALASNASPAAEVLAELSRLPRSIVLTLVQIDGLRLSLSGNAIAENDVHEMAARFRTSRYLNNARIRRLDPPWAHSGNAPDVHAFEIEMDIKP